MNSKPNQFSSLQIFKRVISNRRDELYTTALIMIALMFFSATMIYLLEREAQPKHFSGVFSALWWAVAALTTVGYGDIAPTTPVGQALAAFVMILGYGIIAVPTGIVTAEIAALPGGGALSTRSCGSCEHVEVDPDAKYCRFCDAPIPGRD